MRRILISFVLMGLLCFCQCFHPKPMLCNVSLTKSCPSSLYFVPKQPKSLEETASLFHVKSNLVSKTVDGFVIAVNCSCPADHDEFVWHMDYTVQPGDSWELVSSKFGSFVMELPKKQLIPSQTVTLDLFCGCSGNMHIATYRIEAGDTLYTISSRFGANMDQFAKLNRLDKLDLIHAGDIIFIPVTGPGNLILPSNKDSKARKVSNPHIRIILGCVLAIAVGVVFLFSILFWIFYNKRKGKEQLKAASGGIKCLPCFPALFLPKKIPNQNVVPLFNSDKSTVFTYNEVRDATFNFNMSKKIGEGSYGSVYLGRLRGTEVAIKQMKNTKSKEFMAEQNILCKVHHTNLIELIGYAAGGDSLFLVYEYAQNGALSDHLHCPTMKGYKPVSWTRRVQISLDAAKGLEYIHTHTKPYYVHRDVKTSNILLDSNFRAKIADFGLVKLLEHSPDVGTATSKIVGTFGYLAPEYVRDGCVTTKSDVYSFGVVLMELLTGQPALTRESSSGNSQYVEHRSVVDVILSALEDEHDPLTQLTQCIDPSLILYHTESVFKMALLSKDCVDEDWKRRPDMTRVVLRLSHILQMLVEFTQIEFEPLAPKPLCSSGMMSLEASPPPMMGRFHSSCET